MASTKPGMRLTAIAAQESLDEGCPPLMFCYYLAFPGAISDLLGLPNTIAIRVAMCFMMTLNKK